MGNLIRKWRALWNPEMYHGWGRNSNYFEGWYYKLVSADEKYALAVIPGISKINKNEKYAFIQILDGVLSTSEFFPFDIEEVRVNKKFFELSIGKNHFRKDGLTLNLDNWKAEIQFENLVQWPKYLAAPGIMGWYSFVPFMQCYHAVLSMDHRISGKMETTGQVMDFSGGRGYNEKDWGTSFPKCWIWLQCNHFDDNRKISCTASVAHIPWFGSYFIGFIAGFYFEEKIYRFATYTRAKMRASVSDKVIKMAFLEGGFRLEITANKRKGGALKSPVKGSMIGKIEESLMSQVEVCFYEHKTLKYKGLGRNAGLEVVGDIDVLLSEESRR